MLCPASETNGCLSIGINATYANVHLRCSNDESTDSSCPCLTRVSRGQQGRQHRMIHCYPIKHCLVECGTIPRCYQLPETTQQSLSRMNHNAREHSDIGEQYESTNILPEFYIEENLTHLIPEEVPPPLGDPENMQRVPLAKPKSSAIPSCSVLTADAPHQNSASLSAINQLASDASQAETCNPEALTKSGPQSTTEWEAPKPAESTVPLLATSTENCTLFPSLASVKLFMGTDESPRPETLLPAEANVGTANSDVAAVQQVCKSTNFEPKCAENNVLFSHPERSDRRFSQPVHTTEASLYLPLNGCVIRASKRGKKPPVNSPAHYDRRVKSLDLTSCADMSTVMSTVVVSCKQLAMEPSEEQPAGSHEKQVVSAQAAKSVSAAKACEGKSLMGSCNAKALSELSMILQPASCRINLPNKQPISRSGKSLLDPVNKQKMSFASPSKTSLETQQPEKSSGTGESVPDAESQIVKSPADTKRQDLGADTKRPDLGEGKPSADITRPHLRAGSHPVKYSADPRRRQQGVRSRSVKTMEVGQDFGRAGQGAGFEPLPIKSAPLRRSSHGAETQPAGRSHDQDGEKTVLVSEKENALDSFLDTTYETLNISGRKFTPRSCLCSDLMRPFIESQLKSKCREFGTALENPKSHGLFIALISRDVNLMFSYHAPTVVKIAQLTGCRVGLRRAYLNRRTHGSGTWAQFAQIEIDGRQPRSVIVCDRLLREKFQCYQDRRVLRQSQVRSTPSEVSVLKETTEQCIPLAFIRQRSLSPRIRWSHQEVQREPNKQHHQLSTSVEEEMELQTISGDSEVVAVVRLSD